VGPESAMLIAGGFIGGIAFVFLVWLFFDKDGR
jgi:hypothetical protein